MRAAVSLVVGAVGAVSVAALVLFGIALASTGGGGELASANGARVALRTATIGGVTVLTSEKGHTLYWFAPDSPTSSHCYSTCAAYWPPVIGSPAPSDGIPGNFATIKRSNGANQVTYNGHPLYTYVGDSAPGQATGNDINLNGGFWYEMAKSG